MNLENLVCSIESAKRLKELGVPQESLYQWVEHYNYAQPIRKGSLVWDICPTDIDNKVNHQVSAFTVGELGELLDAATKFDFPSVGKEWRCGYPYTYKRSDGKWWCIVQPYPKGFQGHLDIERRTIHDTEVEARALMLIYLLENSIIQI